MGIAIGLHRRLVKAGAPADLHILDSMWHAFFMDVDLPKSREACAVLSAFFDQHLARPDYAR